jgi:hypothetical protein
VTWRGAQERGFRTELERGRPSKGCGQEWSHIPGLCVPLRASRCLCLSVSACVSRCRRQPVYVGAVPGRRTPGSWRVFSPRDVEDLEVLARSGGNRKGESRLRSAAGWDSPEVVGTQFSFPALVGSGSGASRRVGTAGSVWRRGRGLPCCANPTSKLPTPQPPPPPPPPSGWLCPALASVCPGLVSAQ